MAAPVEGIQDPYLATLYLSTSENLKLYNKAIFGLPESDRCDITRYNWTNLYQELEDAVSTFGFKTAYHIVTAIDKVHNPSE